MPESRKRRKVVRKVCVCVYISDQKWSLVTMVTAYPDRFPLANSC